MIKYFEEKHELELKKSDSKIAFNFLLDIRDMDREDFDVDKELVAKEIFNLTIQDEAIDQEEINKDDFASEIYIGTDLQGSAVKFFKLSYNNILVEKYTNDSDDPTDIDTEKSPTVDSIVEALEETYEYYNED